MRIKNKTCGSAIYEKQFLWAFAATYPSFKCTHVGTFIRSFPSKFVAHGNIER